MLGACSLCSKVDEPATHVCLALLSARTPQPVYPPFDPSLAIVDAVLKTAGQVPTTVSVADVKDSQATALSEQAVEKLP